MHTTLTFADAVAQFLLAARTGKVRTLGGHHSSKYRRLSERDAQRYVGRVRKGAEALTGLTGAALDTADIGPHLQSLPRAAYEAAVEEGSKAARNVRSAARCFVATILNQDVRGSRVRVSPVMFPEEWRRLALALEDRFAKESGRKGLAELLLLARSASERGIFSPHDLPADAETIIGWASGDARVRGRLVDGLQSYRKARAWLKDGSLPACRCTRRKREWGLRTLANLKELVAPQLARMSAAERRKVGPLSSAPIEVLISLVAPSIGNAVSEFLERGQVAERAPDYLSRVVGDVSRLLASLARLDPSVDLSELMLEELWTKTLAREARGGRKLSSAGAQRQVFSLIRLTADRATLYSSKQSPLSAGDLAAREEIPFYGDAVFNAVKGAYYLARATIREELEADASGKGRQTWEAIVDEHRRLIRHMRSFNRDRRKVTGRIDKTDLPITFPELVVRGLPALRREVIEAERRCGECVPGSHASRRAASRFHTLLRRYAIVSTIIADGLRIKNYAGAIANVHVIPVFERDPATGAITGIRKLETHFRGDDCPSVRLKIQREGRGGEFRDRPRTLAPGIIDLRLFFRYWSEVRQADLRKAGLLASGETLDLERERFAAFVSSRAGSGTKARVYGRVGQHTERGLSIMFGQTLLHICADLLRLPNMPADYSSATKGKWRHLFGPHGVRSMVATYFGGLVGDWAYAQEVTDDRQYTLMKVYSKVPARIAGKKGCGTPDDPLWFDGLLKLIRQAEAPFNWARFWSAFDADSYRPERLPEYESLLRTAPQRATIAEKRGGRRGKYLASAA